jgi:N-acetylglutamate synthase-like GNAT family acetyltransferase
VGHHQGQTGPGHPQQPQHVGLEHEFPILVPALRHEVESLGPTRVVDEHVEAVGAGAHPGREGGDVLRARDVQRVHLGPWRTESLGGDRHFPETLHATGPEQEAGAFAGEGTGGGGPESARGAGDEDPTISQWGAHISRVAILPPGRVAGKAEPNRGIASVSASGGRGACPLAVQDFTRLAPPRIVRPMTPPEFIVRRATVEDLGGLKQLWERARLQVLDLEKRLTEFQLAVTPEGDLLGAVGLQIAGKEGLVHSEAFTQAEQGESLRGAFWERLRNLARNHGLVRLWTVEEASFWAQSGFAEPSADTLKKLPGSFGDNHRRWLALQLKDDAAPSLSLEQEFEIFQQSSRASMEEMMSQARKLRTLANVIAWVALGVVVALVAFYGLRHLQQTRASGPATEQR